MPCMLPAIYASASLHVQFASHRVLQVLREFGPGNAGGTMADGPAWIGGRNRRLAPLSLTPIRVPRHTAEN
ncbi:hypothetical protein XAPC_3390 [Xanthomonas citri pv. punicae str. LMG 859]|nr:hypothetical protein XAPC_3390 [Xanthomonas citri pv. punicae str. LMG 859]